MPPTVPGALQPSPSAKRRARRGAPRQLSGGGRPYNGKKLTTTHIVQHAFKVIRVLTGRAPAGPGATPHSGSREAWTRTGRAGTVRRQAVGVSLRCRVSQAI